MRWLISHLLFPEDLGGGGAEKRATPFDPTNPAFNDQIGILWIPPSDETNNPDAGQSISADSSQTDVAPCYAITLACPRTAPPDATPLMPTPSSEIAPGHQGQLQFPVVLLPYPTPIRTCQGPPLTKLRHAANYARVISISNHLTTTGPLQSAVDRERRLPACNLLPSYARADGILNRSSDRSRPGQLYHVRENHPYSYTPDGHNRSSTVQLARSLPVQLTRSMPACSAEGYRSSRIDQVLADQLNQFDRPRASRPEPFGPIGIPGTLVRQSPWVLAETTTTGPINRPYRGLL